MAQRRREKRQAAKQKRMIIVLLVLILLLLLLLGAGGYYALVYRPAQEKLAKGGQREAAAIQGAINNMTQEEIQAALDNAVEEGMFRISIAGNILAVEGGKAQVRIENSIQNRYVMQVSIYLDGTNEEIYATDLIDPGYFIPEAELKRALPVGEYAATAVFTALYADTGDIVGTAGAQVNIIVLPAEEETPEPTATP